MRTRQEGLHYGQIVKAQEDGHAYHLQGIEGVVPGLHGRDKLQSLQIRVDREQLPEVPHLKPGRDGNLAGACCSLGEVLPGQAPVVLVHSDGQAGQGVKNLHFSVLHYTALN